MGRMKAESPRERSLGLSEICVDHAIQSRVKTSVDYEHEFSEAMLRGDVFPPVTVFFDGRTYWLADGFHRYGATSKLAQFDERFASIRCDVRDGSRRDAVIFSAGANKKISIPRNDNDKRRSIRMVLEDEDGFTWPRCRISRHCGVSPHLVQSQMVEFCKKRGVKIPETFVRPATAAGWNRAPQLYESKVGTCRSYSTKIDGAKVNLGTDKKKAAAKLAEIRKSITDPPPPIVAGRTGLAILENNGLKFFDIRTSGGLITGLTGYTGRGCVAVVASDHSHGAFVLAVGKALLSRQHLNPTWRAVILLGPLGSPEAISGMARQLNIELLTPPQLISSLDDDPPVKRIRNASPDRPSPPRRRATA